MEMGMREKVFKLMLFPSECCACIFLETAYKILTMWLLCHLVVSCPQSSQYLNVAMELLCTQLVILLEWT